MNGDQCFVKATGIGDMFSKFKSLTMTEKAGSLLVILFGIGIALGLVATLYNRPNWATLVLRFLLVVLFTTLPAVMYYVFIASRKASLFQEYVNNLSRLGLLRSSVHVDQVTNDRSGNRYFNEMRISSYVKRFEGVYGPVHKSHVRNLLTVLNGNSYDESIRISQNECDDQFVVGLFSPSTSIPVFVATLLIGIGWLLFLPPWIDVQVVQTDLHSPLNQILLANQNPMLFAFLGAYFFSLQMLFRRFVTNDLRSNAFVAISLRIVLGLIAAWVLTILFSTQFMVKNSNEYWLIIMAFILGAFPPVLWRLIRQASSSFTLIKGLIPSMVSKLPISELDGLTVWHQTRLEEEDVENTYNMSNVDIIDLLVSTKIPPERIVDWIDQAILYSAISQSGENQGDDYKQIKSKLASYGIRTASMLEAALANDLNEQAELSLVDRLINDSLQIARIQSLGRATQNYSNYELVRNWRDFAKVESRGTLSLGNS